MSEYICGPKILRIFWNGWKGLEMNRNGWKWLEMAGMS